MALVMHEDPEVVTTWALRLESAGYTVLTGDSEQAVDLALAERPSLVLLDDLVVLGRLRGHEETAMIPVVVLPARTSGGEARDEPLEVAAAAELRHGATTAASIRDVSERRRAEAARAQVFEREREATARLREVDRLRSDFLSTVSHELRTPLTAIKGFAEYLVNMWDTMPDERRRDMVYRILHAGGRLDFLIEDLLDFSKLERGQFPVEVRPHQLSGIVGETLQHLGSSMERHRVDLELDDAAWVMADRSALMRVVENLLTNAVKFSPAGSAIGIRSERRGGHVVLSVRDDGVGIPEEEHEKVFDRFYRVPETAAQYPGTGIGLAIVKQFAEAQGGEVTLSSTAGKGSEFQLRLRPAPTSTPAPA